MLRISTLVWLATAALNAGTPVLTYGTYFSGTGDTNLAVAVVVDGSGNVIITGYTTSQTLPGTANAFQPTRATGFPSNLDVFVAKFDPSGRSLLWATFLGGDGDDRPVAISVDAAGNVYVAGTTQSSNFPVTAGSFQKASPGDAFVSKISSDGSKLTYSSGLPGAHVTALAVNNSGEVYVTGSFNPFPGTSSVLVTQEALNYGCNATLSCMFLVRLNSSGTALVFGANLGGGGGSIPSAVAIDANQNIYVGGDSTVDSIPTTSNALQAMFSNAGLGESVSSTNNGFILELSSAGNQLLYGTYFGPRYANTTLSDLTVTSSGEVYFAGATNGTAYSATPGAYLGTPAGGFIAGFTPGLSTVSAFSYLPGPPFNVCDGASASQACPLGSVVISPQLQKAYGLFQLPLSAEVQLLGLSLPGLGATSSMAATVPNGGMGFFPGALAVASKSAIWVFGTCTACPTIISKDAFQNTYASTSQNSALIQFTDTSPTISIYGSSATGSSPFAAGQLISIYGTQLGPSIGVGGQIGSSGAVTNSDGGTQVLFDGVAAPIVYASASQVNTIVPCAVAGHISTVVVASYLGAQSPPVTLPLSAAAPGIFTVNGTGTGQAAVLNPDGSLNGASNPAVRGSEVVLYATGLGPTSPCEDGQVYTTNFPMFPNPVIVGVANIGADVLYAGQAPSLISGVAQINVVIPSDSPTGLVPLNMETNGIFSPAGVTIAVK
jgi:uncharacterized protein (TIGR03437 family)